ncbi:bifunctional diguanylate cyclase/phosphodiesterase [Sporosarcina sp. E16_8]|uniref:putative bifunctional diguanylate cyclase/phosphodiesterase n=1 Tax=Sporosarcina sp. E16_8 TaxID=2789295 RepID=UPI001A915ACF|nr:bifunctional diguanylate cyclase/phosphodiesterase [Sporosarcina sp. E16_8]MBO0588736.1 EAL domain-containing protein [Sporosarcina sp. E16_8]
MSNLQKTYTDKTEKEILLNWLRRFGSRFQTGFILTDPSAPDDPVVLINEAFTKITGYPSAEVIGQNLRFMQGDETDMELIEEINKKLRKGMPANAEVLNYKKDGTPFWNELVIQPLVDGKGEALFIASFILDVTERKKDESLLRLQEAIFSGINAGAELTDLLKKIGTVVESFFPKGSVCSILFKEENDGWYIGAADSVPDQLLAEIMNNEALETRYVPEDVIVMESNRETVQQGGQSIIDSHSNWSVPTFDSEDEMNGLLTVFMRKTGNPTETQIQFLKGMVPIVQMTRKHYTQQAEYRRLAFTDPQTGLPNRHAFLNQLKHNVLDGQGHFVAIIEPGEYAKIVDLYGRNAADELFIQLGKRIEKAGKGNPNFIGRFSSASLVITGESGEGNYLFELSAIVSEPFIVAGQDLFITLKIGISFSEGDQTSEEELLRRADIAMSNAKKKPGNAMSFYRDLQNEESIKEMRIFNELSRALIAQEIEVYLQPKVNLKDGEIIGFEALARWFSPVLGPVPPNLFIPAAENIGKIIDLEIIVISKVMEWQRKREQSGGKMYQVAVNISVHHFFDRAFVVELKKLAANYDLSPKHIMLEMTESIGLVDLQKAKLIFHELNAAGFEISVDDFGVGYSSLSYLPQLPLCELKIDRSFISALDEPGTLAVVRTIIQLAENLNLTTVAEGIEEERHIDILRNLGCKVGQGFYYYKPMPLKEIERLLAE